MPKWIIHLTGDPADLEALAALDGGVLREAAGFVFQSPDLDHLTDARAIDQAVTQRIEVLKGLIRVMTGDKKQRTITVGAIRREEHGKKDYILVIGPAELELQGGIVGDTSAWVAAGFRDPAVVGWALQLFAGEPTPASMYKVLEVLQDDLGGQMVKLGWTTNREISRFTGTIDSVHHLGVQARHGVQRNKPIDEAEVMSVREMRDFIRGLLAKWLDSKAR